MAKQSTVFVCSGCGAFSPKWIGKCPSCGAWNTYVEEITEKPALSAASTYHQSKPVRLSEIKEERLERIKSGSKELDTVLGGGIVPGSLILIGGDPGIGKSTLLTQVAGNLAKRHKVLYASAEESCSQVKLRYQRLGVDSDGLLLLNDTLLENIEANSEGVDFLIVDSIQAVYLESMSSAAGSVGQVRECAARLMRLAKNKNITVFIVGHVTKEGSLAGPKVLEHIMDTVLYFEGENTDSFKILRAVKNRFGPVSEIGVFEMHGDGLKGVEDYSGIFLSDSRGLSAGSIVTPFMSGTRCVPVEIQCLVTKSVFGMPRRMPLGIDYNKLALLLAVLEKRAGVLFYTFDVYMNAMGGIKLNEPSVDLGIVLSAVSANKNQSVDKDTAAFGEVGLTGEVRGVHFAEKRVLECIKLGLKRVILPKHNYNAVKKYEKDIEIVPVSYLNQAVKTLFKNI